MRLSFSGGRGARSAFAAIVLLSGLPVPKAPAQESAPSPAQEPAEVKALRLEYQHRLVEALTPADNWYRMQLRTRLEQYKRAGDLATALRLQSELENPDPRTPPPSDKPLPPDLAGIRSTYVVNAQRLTQPVVLWYRQQLEGLERSLIQRGSLQGAQLVRTARAEVDPGLVVTRRDSAFPAAANPNVKQVKLDIVYRYREASFCKGIFDYTDTACSKLLDGKIEDQHSPHMVAWLNTKPSPVRFEFAVPRILSIMRVHVLGGNPKLGYQVPASIEVRDASGSGIGQSLGAIRDLADQSGWVQIPLKPTHQVRVVWLVMERSKSDLVGIDEVEFP